MKTLQLNITHEAFAVIVNGEIIRVYSKRENARRRILKNNYPKK